MRTTTIYALLFAIAVITAIAVVTGNLRNFVLEIGISLVVMVLWWGIEARRVAEKK